MYKLAVRRVLINDNAGTARERRKEERLSSFWNTKVEARMAMIKAILEEDKKHPGEAGRLKSDNGYVVSYITKDYPWTKVMEKYMILEK